MKTIRLLFSAIIVMLAAFETKSANSGNNCDAARLAELKKVNVDFFWVTPQFTSSDVGVNFLKHIEPDLYYSISKDFGGIFKDSEITGGANIILGPPLSSFEPGTSVDTESVEPAVYNSFRIFKEFADDSANFLFPKRESEPSVFKMVVVFTDQKPCSPNNVNATETTNCIITNSEAAKIKKLYKENKYGLLVFTTSNEAKKVLDDAFQKDKAEDFLYSAIAVPAIEDKTPNQSDIVKEMKAFTKHELEQFACRKLGLQFVEAISGRKTAMTTPTKPPRNSRTKSMTTTTTEAMTPTTTEAMTPMTTTIRRRLRQQQQ